MEETIRRKKLRLNLTNNTIYTAEPMDNKSLNLAVLADKLYNGKWMLSGTVHSQLCDQFQKLLTSDIDPSKFLTEPTEFKAQSGDSKLADVGTGPVVGIVHIKGILAKGPSFIEQAYFGFVDVDDVSNALDQAAVDPDIKEIYCNWMSPGGETTGIEELSRKLAYIDKNVKPVYSFTSQLMCSAAFFAGVNSRKIGMTPSSAIGSVGVYCLVLDETEFNKKVGQEVIPFQSGKFKTMGHPWRSLTKEEKSILQADVDKAGAKFRAVVSSNRPQISADDLEGLSYEGEEALAKGFVDSLADSLDAFIKNIESENTSMKVEKKAKTEAKAPETIVKEAAAVEPKVEVAPDTKAEVKEPTTEEKLAKLAKEFEDFKKATEAKKADIPGLPGVKTDEKVSDDDEEDDDEEDCDKMEAKAEVKELSVEEFRSIFGITKKPVSKEVADFRTMCKAVEESEKK